MRFTIVLLFFCQILYSQDPFELIEQFVTEDTKSYTQRLTNKGYSPITELNTDTELNFRKGDTSIFIATSTCDYLVITSSNQDVIASIDKELLNQEGNIEISIEYGRKRLLWFDGSNNKCFVYINPDDSYELYYANCLLDQSLGK